MPIPTCIQNHILVSLDKKFQDEMVADGGTKFYKDSSFRPEWNTTIKGKVVSVPQKLTQGNGKSQSLYPDRPRMRQVVKVGDEIIFSYTVIMNRKEIENVGEVFTRDKPKDPYTTVWSNPNGQQIVRVYLNNDKYEIGLFDTHTRTWVDRIKGNESDVESFMGKYMPTQNVGYNYKNLLPYEDEDYWMVDYIAAIAIKRAEGIFDMIGEYCLLEPIHDPNRKTYDGDLFVYNAEQSNDYVATGKLLSIGSPLAGDNPLTVKPNDTVVTDIRYVEKYEIDGHDYWIVRQKYIYGKQSVTNDSIRN